MTPHFIVIGGLLFLVAGLVPAAVVFSSRRPGTPVAYLQLFTAAMLGIFFSLSLWPNGPRFDHLVGMPGAGWLVYQTALSVAALGDYTILVESTTRNWRQWRWQMVVGLALVTIFWVSALQLVHRSGVDTTYVFYQVTSGRPAASLVMNVAVGLVVLWASVLCARLCYQWHRMTHQADQRHHALYVLVLASLGVVLGATYAAQPLVGLATGNDSALFPVIDAAGSLIVVIWIGRVCWRATITASPVRSWLLAELEPEHAQLRDTTASQLEAMSGLNRTIYDQAVHLSEYADRTVVAAMTAWCDVHHVTRTQHDYLHLAASMFTLNRSNLEGLAYHAADPEQVRAADEELAHEAQFRGETETFASGEAARVLRLVLGTERDWRMEPPGVRRDGAAALLNILRAHKHLEGGPFTPPPPFLAASPDQVAGREDVAPRRARRQRPNTYSA